MSVMQELGKVSVTPKGEFSAEITYERLDIIEHEGNSYIAVSDVPAGTELTDSRYWQRIASKGDKGDTGAKGPQGDPGPAGADGKDAVIDATLAQSGQAADAKATGDAIGQLKNDLDSFTYIDKSINLFNPNDSGIKYSSKIWDDGSIKTNSAWADSHVTGFVYIDVNKSKTLRHTLVTAIRVGEYKADGTFIKLTEFTNSSPMTLNDETVKIRIQFYEPEGLMVYQSDNVQPYVDYYVNRIIEDSNIPSCIARKTDVDNIQEQVDSFKNKYEITNYMLFVDVYEGKKYSDGILSDYQYGNATSMVELDKNYDMYVPSADGQAVFFDENKKYISSLTLKYTSPILKYNYPTNAMYVAFWYMTEYLSCEMYVVRTHNAGRNIRNFYPTTKKKVGERPRIDIYTTDTEIEIFKKMADAFLTKDCDVYFEHGNYSFDSLWVDLYETYNVRNYLEIPIGGNCKYFFNGSTLTASQNEFNNKGYSGVIDMLSCTDSNVSESYDLYDGIFIGNGINYIVHDECGGKDNWYSHKYKNIKMKYTSGESTQPLRKCVGGGTGLFGESYFEDCVLETDYNYDLSFHGIGDKEDVSDFKLILSNCYLSKQISLDNLATNQTASLVMSGCSAKYIHQTGVNNKWDVTSWCNEVRSE